MKTKRLKIIESGTSYCPTKRVPMIRTRGHWLRKAGFSPNSYLQLTLVSPGVIELRAIDGAMQGAPEPSNNEKSSGGRLIERSPEDFGRIINQDFGTDCPAVAVEFIGTDQPITDITVVLDRSASMACKTSETVQGLNKFVGEQRKIGGDAVLTLIQFNDDIATTFEAVDIDSVELLAEKSFVPTGNTALLDAIGAAIEQATKRALITNRIVVIAVLTDGKENVSRRFTREAIFELIRTKQQDGWQFLFLGASQDAIQQSADIGIPADATLAYENTGEGTRKAFASASASIKRLRKGDKRISFSVDERSARSKLRSQQRQQRPSKN